MTDPMRHSLIEDVQGIAFGVCMAAVGMHVLTFSGFVAGQTTGVAALIAYGFNLPFPAVYFAVSLPFLWFGWRRMGARFALKTLITIAALSVLTSLLPRWLGFSHIHPAFAALLFGILFGIAALAVVRHGGSFGGISILWLMLQDRTGFPAGYAQLGFDIALFAVSALILEPGPLLWSFAGAVIFNLFLAINHRKDRYIAT
ncbi:COG1284 Uncharacterized conserved protein [Paracoccaceae bacterium]